jgi:hypothetical protein
MRSRAAVIRIVDWKATASVWFTARRLFGWAVARRASVSLAK